MNREEKGTGRRAQRVEGVPERPIHAGSDENVKPAPWRLAGFGGATLGESKMPVLRMIEG